MNAFADKVLACANGQVTKDEMLKWFDDHKFKIQSHTKSREEEKALATTLLQLLRPLLNTLRAPISKLLF